MTEERVPFWYPDLRTIVAISMLGIFGGVTGMLLFKPMPMSEAAGTLLTAMVGMIVGKVSTIVDYYFGSNKEAKDQAADGRAQSATIATMAASGIGPAVVTNGPDETTAWNEAVAANTSAEFVAYLKKFPSGSHAAEAKARIAALANP